MTCPGTCQNPIWICETQAYMIRTFGLSSETTKMDETDIHPVGKLFMKAANVFYLLLALMQFLWD